MNPNSTTDALKQAWREQPTNPPTISLEDVKRGAQKFQRFVGVGNLIEYAAAVVVVIGYSQMLLGADKLLVKIGCVLIIMATMYIVVQIHVRLSSKKLPAELSASFVEFHRAAVRRHIAGLRSIESWYLLPFLPGWTMFIIQSLIERRYSAAASLVGMAIVISCVCIAWNRFWARRLQAKLDAMDAGLDPEHRRAA